MLSCVTSTGRDIIREEDARGGALRFYGVYHIAKGPEGKLWAITRPMECAHTPDGNGTRVRPDTTHIVELGARVRRAGAAYVCDEQCVPHPREQRMTHSASVCDGGLYEVWTRQHGSKGTSASTGAICSTCTHNLD